MFKLHPTLEKDCINLGDFKLSRVLLMNDSQYPWLILVPREYEIKEIYQLKESDQIQFLKESSFLSEQMVGIFKADKINIAALGNRVPQLHIHHIARFTDDACWPNPVWGQLPVKKYNSSELEALISKVQQHLGSENKTEILFKLPENHQQ